MGKEEKNSSLQKGWVESIADAVKCDVSEVKAFVKRNKIVQTPALGTPKRINITAIEFSGTKKGEFTGDFDFSFDDLGPGIWGIFTDGNGKGKSTALELIKWLFKGSVPGNLQAGVKSWMKHIRLCFNIDQVNHQIKVEQNEDQLTGVIERSKREGEYTVVKEFNGEDEMAEVISAFMLSELEMAEMSTYRQGVDELTEGKEVVHGWPSLAAAMFIGTDYSAIFGDIAVAGMTNRIMNMFLGLPWIPTAVALQTLERSIKSTASVETKLTDWADNNRQGRLETITSELNQAIKKRDQATQPKTNNEAYHKLLDEYSQVYTNLKTAQRDQADAQLLLREVSMAATEDEIKLRNFLEDHAANKVFKRLQPKCCPHCDRKVTVEDLKRERADNTCSVCEHEMLDGEDSEEVLAELKITTEASKKALTEQKRVFKEKKDLVEKLENEEKQLSGKVTDYKADMLQDVQSRGALEKLIAEIGRLEILKEEYTKQLGSVGNAEAVVQAAAAQLNKPDDKKILAAALKETLSRYKGLQSEILKEVSEKMFELCAKVGLSQYRGIELTSNPNLLIDKDGMATSFSKVSPGEKLRLKVIALLALISVAERRGVGRHPGFLVIDSPASQDVAEKDLQELIGGLKKLANDLPYLQVIIASRANPVLLELIPEENRKYARGSDFLW